MNQGITAVNMHTSNLKLVAGFFGDNTTLDDMLAKGFVPMGDPVLVDPKIGLLEDNRPSFLKGRDIALPAIRHISTGNPGMEAYDAILRHVDPDGKVYLQAYRVKSE